MQYEPLNGFLFVEEREAAQEGTGFAIYGGEASQVVEATIVSPGSSGHAPGETVVFRRDVSMAVSFDGRKGILINKDHLLAKREAA